MDRKAVVAGLLPALLLNACDRTIVPPEPGGASHEHSAAPVAATRNARASSFGDSSPGAPTPPELTPDAEKGVKGARNLLLALARAIERKEFGRAQALLGFSDRKKWSKAELARQFGDLRQITVALPEGTMEAACGSFYYTAPLTITGSDKDGRPVRYQGEAAVRRINDVQGATPAQLRWHFQRLTLDWTH